MSAVMRFGLYCLLMALVLVNCNEENKDGESAGEDSAQHHQKMGNSRE